MTTPKRTVTMTYAFLLLLTICFQVKQRDFERKKVEEKKIQTRVTSTSASRKAFKSWRGMARSVIVSCTEDTGMMSERLRRPNLEESQTTIVRRAASDMARLTRASS